jgi:hypothetical protein
MAMALEELATGVVESAVGPWALVLAAGAVAVACATRSARPVNRMLTGGVVAADASGRVNPRQWLRSIRQGVRNLVDEARSEYEAGQLQPPVTAELAADRIADAAQARSGQVLVADAATSRPAELEASRRRDVRGRFVPRSPNGPARA